MYLLYHSKKNDKWREQLEDAGWMIIEDTDSNFKGAREITIKLDELKIKDYRKGENNE